MATVSELATFIMSKVQGTPKEQDVEALIQRLTGEGPGTVWVPWQARERSSQDQVVGPVPALAARLAGMNQEGLTAEQMAERDRGPLGTGWGAPDAPGVTRWWKPGEAAAHGYESAEAWRTAEIQKIVASIESDPTCRRELRAFIVRHGWSEEAPA